MQNMTRFSFSPPKEGNRGGDVTPALYHLATKMFALSNEREFLEAGMFRRHKNWDQPLQTIPIW